MSHGRRLRQDGDGGRFAVGCKSSNARTTLPCTTLVELALGRVPKENLASIEGCVVKAIDYYERMSVPLRGMNVNVHFDDSQAGRLTAKSLQWCFYRDIRHQIAAERRHRGPFEC